MKNKKDVIKHFKKSKKGDQFDYMEIYRRLRTNLEYSSFEKKLQIINITSTNPSEGKSTVASNLAIVCIAQYKKVLLIDCDLRKPVQHKLFRITNSVGVSDVLKNMDTFDANPDKYFQKFKDKEGLGRLFVLTSGKKVPNPQEMLSSTVFTELMAKLRDLFELIIIDCPPIAAVADAIPISNVADGTLLVVSAKETNKHDVKTALTQLRRNGANVVGCALTKVDQDTVNYSYYYNEE